MFEGLHGGMNNRGRGLRYTMCKVLEGLGKWIKIEVKWKGEKVEVGRKSI